MLMLRVDGDVASHTVLQKLNQFRFFSSTLNFSAKVAATIILSLFAYEAQCKHSTYSVSVQSSPAERISMYLCNIMCDI